MTMPRIRFRWKTPLTAKPSITIVMSIVVFVGFNILLRQKIEEAPAPAVASTSSPEAFTQIVDRGKGNCPSARAGNPDAPLTAKMFFSPSCPYCVEEEQVIAELLLQRGDLFYVEWYDVSACADLAKQYQVLGVPTFVFTTAGVERPSAYGFIEKNAFDDFICRVAGGC